MLRAAAFDEVAAQYDDAFTDTLLGRLLRERVWQVVVTLLRPGQRVLELACGTGEDALWLARRGATVVATDGSPEMIEVARQKAARVDLEAAIDFRTCSLQQLSAGLPAWVGELDGVLSNFGGLNTIGDWRPLARALAGRVRPGGWLLLVVMGPFCPWEIGWQLLHGQTGRAVRRLREPALARVGGRALSVWYPSPRRLAQAFAPSFRPCQTRSLGLWLPPTELSHLVARYPGLFSALNRVEQTTARFTAGWGDHYLLLLEKC